MTTHVIDNSLSALGKTVLWQYDKAVRLLAVIKHLQVWYHCAVEQFWKYWVEKVLAVDTCDSFGCSIWGMMLGIERPMITASTGEKRLIVTSVYRKLLKASFYLYKADSSFGSIAGYLNILFCVDGLNNLSKWQVQVSEYGWYTNVDEINGLYQSGRAYKKGEVFWYHTEEDSKGSNWKCTEDIGIGKNISFENLLANGLIQRTLEPTTAESGSSIITLKLYDPEGIERAMGIGYKNALSVSVEYVFGTTKVTAEIMRTVKCGVGIRETGDLTLEYFKTQFYDEMHRDQKALYEQLFSEVCPYPLGIGDPNEVVEEWVFGFGACDFRDKFPKFDPSVRYKFGDLVWDENPNYDPDSPYYHINTKYGLYEFGADWYAPNWKPGDWRPVNLVDSVVDIGQENVQYEAGIEYKQGEIFGYVDEEGHGFNYKCLANIPAKENQSFKTIESFVQKTQEGDPFVESFSNQVPPYIDITWGLCLDDRFNLPRLGYFWDQSGKITQRSNNMANIVAINSFVYDMHDKVSNVTEQGNLKTATSGGMSNSLYMIIPPQDIDEQEKESLIQSSLDYLVGIGVNTTNIIIVSDYFDREAVIQRWKENYRITKTESFSVIRDASNYERYLPMFATLQDGEALRVLYNEKMKIQFRWLPNPTGMSTFDTYIYYTDISQTVPAPKTSFISGATLARIGQQTYLYKHELQ